MKILVSQLQIFDGDINKNKSRIKKIVDNLNLSNIDLICFPELSLTGYDYELIKKKEIANLSKERS